MRTVRVTERAVVTTSDGITHSLKTDAKYSSDDLVVKEFGWAFASDNVEQATAGPGERRAR